MNLIQVLRRIRAQIIGQEVLAGLLFTVLFAAIYWTCAYLLYRSFSIGFAALSLMGLAGLVAAAVFLVWLVVVPAFRRHRLRQIAVEMEQGHPEAMDRFSTALYLGEKEEEVKRLGFSPDLVAATRDWAEQESSRILTTPKWSRERPLAIVTVAVLACIGLLTVLDASQMGRFATAFTSSLSARSVHLPELAFLLPEETVVPRGEPAVVEFQIEGDWIPGDVSALGRIEAGDWVELDLARTDSGAFQAKTPAVVMPMALRVSAGKRVSETVRITPVDPPRSTEFRITRIPPPYTGLPRETETSLSGEFSALPGTIAQVAVTANNPLRSAVLQAPDGQVTVLDVNDADTRQAAGASFQVREEGFYTLTYADIYGLESRERERYAIGLEEDRAPDIALVEPPDQIDVPGSMDLHLEGFASDDFGISAATLVYEFDFDLIPISVALYPHADTRTISFTASAAMEAATGSMTAPSNPVTGQPQRFNISLDWDLASLNLLPGDELTYWVEAADNNTVTGPSVSRSRAKRLRYPSLHEIHDEMTAMETDVVDEFKDVMERAEDFTERVEEFQEDMAEKKKLGEQADYNDAKNLEDLKNEAQEIEEDLRQLSEKAQKIEERAAQQPTITMETIEKMARINELMNELLTDDMKRVMNQLQQALDQMNMNRDLSRMDMEFNAEEFEEQLDRQLSMLEDTYFERQFETLQQETESLLNDMEALEELTEQSEAESGLDEETLAERQEQLNERAEELMEQMDNMAERFGESKPEEAQKLSDMAQQAREEGLQEAMEQAERKLSQGDREGGNQEQQKASQCMSNLSRKMEEMGESMLGGGAMEIEIAEVRRLFDRILDLSMRQEDLVTRLQSIESLMDWGSHDLKRELAQQQSLYADESTRIDGAAAEHASENPFFNFDIIGHLRLARASMDKALELSVDNEPRIVRHHAGFGLKHVNTAGALLLDNMEQLMNMASQSSSGSGDMMEQLQQMISQQQNLNQKSKGARQQQARPMSPQQQMNFQQQLQRMADEQAAVQQELQRFMQQFGQSPDQQVREVAEQLEGTGEAAGEAERLIRQKDLSERLEDKQNEVLTRLLDAEKSMNEQGYEEKRKARPAEDENLVRQPGELPDRTEEIRDRILEARQDRTGEEFVLPSYRDRVREYFRQLSDRAMESL